MAIASTRFRYVLARFASEQAEQLRGIADALLTQLDPDRRMTALYAPSKLSATSERKPRFHLACAG